MTVLPEEEAKLLGRWCSIVNEKNLLVRYDKDLTMQYVCSIYSLVFSFFFVLFMLPNSFTFTNRSCPATFRSCTAGKEELSSSFSGVSVRKVH